MTIAPSTPGIERRYAVGQKIRRSGPKIIHQVVAYFWRFMVYFIYSRASRRAPRTTHFPKGHTAIEKSGFTF